MTIVLTFSLFISVGAIVMTRWNLSLYAPPPIDAPASGPSVTVCIPARNEEANLEACVRSVLESGYNDLRVLVYDDGSTDATPDILAGLADDPRVTAASTEPLPEGWNGKQHACDQMGRQTTTDWMLFTDADVRFESAAVARSVAFAKQADAKLVSCFPRQLTATLPEKLAVPMIFFILLSYLPIARMRSSIDPSASAACGQFILAQREAYLDSGGHAAFKNSMHDGVKMPRAFRTKGYKTDLFDGTGVARVRMYEGLTQTWNGFAKNAYEGLGSVGLLTFITVLHLVGHVLPWIALPILIATGAELLPISLAAACCVTHIAQRATLAARFKQGLTPVLLHPLGVVMMTLIQWDSLRRHLSGKRTWRGRTASA